MTEMLQNKSVPEVLKSFLEKNKGKAVLVEYELKNLLRELGLPVPKGTFVPGNLATAIPSLSDLTFPVAAKISSSKIASKSDVGGVRIGLQDSDALAKAAHELLQVENAEGVYVEEMAEPGFEVIVGGSIDEQFGPVVMLGLGGLFVEFFREVVFALAPLSEKEALGFVKRFKAYRLFEGYRGMPALDLDALLHIVIVVSELMASRLISEIDLNPLALYPKGAMILDAKMQLLKSS